MSKFVAMMWGSSKEDKQHMSSLTNSRGQRRPVQAIDVRRQKLMDTLTQSPARTSRGAARSIDPLGLGEAVTKHPHLVRADEEDEAKENRSGVRIASSAAAVPASSTPLPAHRACDGKTTPPKSIMKKAWHQAASPLASARTDATMGVLSPTKEFIKGAFLGEGVAQADMNPDSAQMQKAMRDVEAFAKYLGMDPVVDREYFWIAVEAMIAPLPPNWTEYFEGDQAYYFNQNTSTTQWEHPLDEYHRKLFRKHKDEALALQRMLARHGGAIEEENFTEADARLVKIKKRSMLSGGRFDGGSTGDEDKEVKAGEQKPKTKGRGMIVQPTNSDLMGGDRIAGMGGEGGKWWGAKKKPLMDRTNAV